MQSAAFESVINLILNPGTLLRNNLCPLLVYVLRRILAIKKIGLSLCPVMIDTGTISRKENPRMENTLSYFTPMSSSFYKFLAPGFWLIFVRVIHSVVAPFFPFSYSLPLSTPATQANSQSSYSAPFI